MDKILALMALVVVEVFVQSVQKSLEMKCSQSIPLEVSSLHVMLARSLLQYIFSATASLLYDIEVRLMLLEE